MPPPSHLLKDLLQEPVSFLQLPPLPFRGRHLITSRLMDQGWSACGRADPSVMVTDLNPALAGHILKSLLSPQALAGLVWQFWFDA